MVDAGEQGDERLLDAGEIPQGEVAVVELALLEPLADDAFYQLLDAFAGRSHGEAIAVGMVFAARLSEARGLGAEGLTARTLRLLSSLGLDTDGPMPPTEDILHAFPIIGHYRW